MFAPSVGARNEVGKFCTGRYGATSRQSVTQLHETKQAKRAKLIKSEGENGRRRASISSFNMESQCLRSNRKCGRIDAKMGQDLLE